MDPSLEKQNTENLKLSILLGVDSFSLSVLNIKNVVLAYHEYDWNLSSNQSSTEIVTFANEIIKTVPIIFRFYNNYDPVQAVPACYTENGRCISEFGMKELNKSLNYKKKY